MMESSALLAFDTSTPTARVALISADGECLVLRAKTAARHSANLLGLVDEVLRESGLAVAGLGAIACGAGPGSFTGLRVGLSAARGIGLAANKPVVGLTTLSAYAAPVVSRNDEHPVISAIDARHDHVYFQVVSGNGSSLIRPKVAPIGEALAASRFGAPHMVGNAARILADRWPVDAPPPFKVEPQPAPDIAWLAWLGAAVSPETSPPRPYYLRAPDAKVPGTVVRASAQPSAP